MTFDMKDLLIQVDEYLYNLPPMPSQSTVPLGTALARWIDHTLLKPEASSAQIKKLCEEARQFHFATVCINPVNVSLAFELLNGSDSAVCSVVGFPLGATYPEIKAAETRKVIADGATEVDTVINIGALKSGNFDLVMDDVLAVVKAASGKAHVKVILETCTLDQREKIIGSLICKNAGADFVKTSTGFGAGGATVDDVTLMRRVVGASMGVKAAGGIRTLQDAVKMISAGANRLGASAGITIMKEAGVVV